MYNKNVCRTNMHSEAEPKEIDFL